MAHQMKTENTTTQKDAALSWIAVSLMGAVGLAIGLFTALSGLAVYGLVVILAVLLGAGYEAWRGQHAWARYLTTVAVFGVLVYTLGIVGGGSVMLLVLPLFVAGVGILLLARDALIFGVLSAWAYDVIAYAQVQRELALAPMITQQEYMLRVALGTLSLLGLGFVVNAGVQRWEDALSRNTRRASALEAALEVGIRVTSVQGLDEMLNRIVILICQQFGYNHAMVFLLNREKTQAVLRAATGDMGQKEVAQGYRRAVGSQTVIGQTAAGMGPLVALISDSDEILQRNELRFDTRSELALPLEVDGQVLGVLDVQSSDPQAFKSGEAEILRKVAGQIAVAVENARTLTDTATLLEKMSPAFLAGRELATTNDPDEVLDILRRHVTTDADRLELVQLDWGGNEEVHASTLAVWDRENLAPFGVHFADLELSLTNPLPYFFDNLSTLDADSVKPTLKGLLERLRVRAFAAFPLLHRGTLNGFLLVYRRESYQINDSEMQTMLSLADQIAIVVENLRLADSISKQNDRIAILNELSRTISGVFDVEEIEQEVAGSVRRILRYEHLSLAMQEGNPEQPSVALHVLSSDGEEPAGTRMFPTAHTAIGLVLSTAQTLFEGDLATSSYKDHRGWHAEGLTGMVVTPLAARGHMFGTLNLGFGPNDALSPDDVGVLEHLATQLAIALDNARLIRVERRRREEAAVLLEIAETTGSTLDLTQVLKEIAIHTARVCEVDRVTVFLFDPDTQNLVPIMGQYADGHTDDAQWSKFRRDTGFSLQDSPLVQEAMSERRAVVLDDVTRYDLVAREWTEPFGINRLAIIPLLRPNREIGLMILDYNRPPDRQFVQEQLDLALTIGSQVAVSIENARLIDQLQGSLAETTSLYNASIGINAAVDLDQLVEVSVTELAYLSDADRVRFFQAGPDPRTLVTYLDEMLEWRGKNEILRTGYRSKPVDIVPLNLYPMTHDNIVLNDVEQSTLLPEEHRRALVEDGVGSLAMIPLVAGATWLGAIVMDKFDRAGFSDDVVRLARNLADQTALALDAQLLLQDTRRSAARENVLREISARLRQAPDVETVLQVAVEELGSALGVREGAAHIGQVSDDGSAS